MAAPKKYSDKFGGPREPHGGRGAGGSGHEPQSDEAESRSGGTHPEALPTWVRQAKVDGGVRRETTTHETARNVELEQ